MGPHGSPRGGSVAILAQGPRALSIATRLKSATVALCPCASSFAHDADGVVHCNGGAKVVGEALRGR